MDEWELLQRFAQHGSQEAFAELVARHVNFVYSAARRQVRSTDLAQEVAQLVFLELARQAARLRPGMPLTAWLYIVTRRTALNTLRSELRRQAREHVAYELSTMHPSPTVWEKLAPQLDQALESLNPRDRSALLLRYFENKPLREVGAALGASEEAAQKRVARALEQLRRFFTRQGVTISAAGLATHLSAHAVEAAPVALSEFISSATGSWIAASPGVIFETTRAIAMTTFQKTLFVGALAALAASVYEVRALAGQKGQLLGLEKELDRLSTREIAALQERDAARNRATAVQIERKRPADATTAPATGDPMIAELVSRATQLKQHFAENAALKIPEMALLTDGDWLDIARERSLGSDADLRASLARVRTVSKSKMSSLMTRALGVYVSANEGRLPVAAGELQPLIGAAGNGNQRFALPTPLDPVVLSAILARYEIKVQGLITQVPDNAVLILEREQALIDMDYDTQTRISRSGSGLAARGTNPLQISTINGFVPGRLAPLPQQYLR